jgi:hypothetical protein
MKIVPYDEGTAALIARAEAERVSDLRIARESEPQKWAAAVTFLRSWLSPLVQQEVREVIRIKSPDWPAGYHMGWGMGVRNALREHGFGEKGFGVLNLDNIYVELVEEAVQS